VVAVTSPEGASKHPLDATPGGAALLAIAFVAETAMLAGLFWAGWSLGSTAVSSWAVGFLFAGAVAVVWGLWCAPRARARLRNPARRVLKSALFVATLGLLVAFAPRPEGAVFGLGTLLLFAISLPADRDPEDDS
jgi:protein-S-isoprenylcysteine O-methyltransferase Ste14